MLPAGPRAAQDVSFAFFHGQRINHPRRATGEAGCCKPKIRRSKTTEGHTDVGPHVASGCLPRSEVSEGMQMLPTGPHVAQEVFFASSTSEELFVLSGPPRVSWA